MRRAAVYARVSTRRQEKEATIESQLAQLASYVQQQGYDVPEAHRFVDQAVSGQRLARPGLDRLRDAAAAGAFEVLLCTSPDRLARNLGAQQVILEEMRRCGVEVIFLNQPALEDSPQAQLLLNIQGAFAEYERVVISERMRRGRLYRLRQGQTVSPHAPYGYRYQPATPEHASGWVVVPEQAEVVKQMFAWYTSDTPISLGTLARLLNEQQIPGPDGERWWVGTLGRLLRQPAYTGTGYYNRHQADYGEVGHHRQRGQGTLRFPRSVPRPVEDWIAFSVPALVDEATWHLAQERLEMNAHFASRNSHHCYLLRGLLVCGLCGHTLQGRTQDGRVYYTCPYGGVHCPPGIPPHTCSVRGDVVEALVWQALADVLRDPQGIQDAWNALQAEQAATPHELTQGQQRLALLEKQRQRLLDAYQAGLISLEELTERQNPVQVEVQVWRKRLADAPHLPPLQIALETFTQRIEQALTASDFETRQEVIRLLIERIVVTDEALTVEHIVPTVNDSRLHLTCRET